MAKSGKKWQKVAKRGNRRRIAGIGGISWEVGIGKVALLTENRHDKHQEISFYSNPTYTSYLDTDTTQQSFKTKPNSYQTMSLSEILMGGKYLACCGIG